MRLLVEVVVVEAMADEVFVVDGVAVVSFLAAGLLMVVIFVSMSIYAVVGVGNARVYQILLRRYLTKVIRWFV